MTSGKDIKYRMVMYLQRDCDPTRDVNTIWLYTCRGIVTPGRDVTYSMVMYLSRVCDPGQRRKVQYGVVLLEEL